jgi:AAA15 family ATPase/GTPase
MTSPYRENERELKIAHAQAVKEKAIDIIVKFIRKNIDPAIKKIDMTVIDGVSRFFVTSDTFEKSIDITNYGEGVRRVFEIALFFAYARNGVLLIDEFETAIHKSLLVNFTRFVQELAERFNVQVFLTSHSKECIDSFIMNNYRTEDITAYQLKEEKGVISCKYVEGKRLKKLLESIDEDIRGG